MHRVDLHGRIIGGLFEACGATNPLFRNQRLEVIHSSTVLGGGAKPSLINGNTGTVGLGQGTFVGPSNQNVEDEIGTGKKRKGRAAKATNSISTTSVATAVPMEMISLGSSVAGAPSITKSGNLNTHNSSSSTSGIQQTQVEAAELPRSGKKSKTATVLYCVCKSPWEEQEFMIACDGPCEGWFHPKCLGYITTGKKDVFLQDADGTKLDTNNPFFCPWCEVGLGAAGNTDANDKKAATLSGRISKWCDVADMGDENISLEENETPFMTRWRILLQARNSVNTIAACRSCSKQHHPLLTCPIPASSLSITSHKRGTSPRLGEQSCPEEANSLLPVKLSNPSGELYALVVCGKYHTLKGKVVGTSKKWSQLCLDLDETSLIIVPNCYLLFSRGASFTTPVNETETPNGEPEATGLFGRDFNGVVPAATGGGFIAYYDLDESSRIYLGRYSSRVRAARAYDLAAKLQCGDNEQVHGKGVTLLQLNFPDRTRILGSVTQQPKSGASSPSLFDKATLLAHTIATGPFPQNSFSITSNSDNLHVLAWTEDMLQELEEVPPYYPFCSEVCTSLMESVAVLAEGSASRVSNYLKTSVPLPQSESTLGAPSGSASTQIETDAEEDELDIVVKKFIRTRSAKPKRSVPI